MVERTSADLELDVSIAPGMSAHVFGDVIGIYSARIDAGRGFVEMPVSDFVALVKYFTNAEGRGVLDRQEPNP